MWTRESMSTVAGIECSKAFFAVMVVSVMLLPPSAKIPVL
jgi:hypothetical protein